jgi:hypothetical protein
MDRPMPRSCFRPSPHSVLAVTAAAALMAGTLAGCGWFGSDDPSGPSAHKPKPTEVTENNPEDARPRPPGSEVAPKPTEPPPRPRKPVPELPPELPSTQELAAKELERIGAKVKFNKNEDVDEVDFSGLDITDEYLKLLEPFPFVNVLNLTDTPITDAGLKHLENMEFLRFLYLYGTNIQGPGLVHLKTLPRLEHLCLDETQVGDAGLEHLGDSYRLEVLHLATKKPITAEGLQKLHGLENLREIQFMAPGPPAEAIEALKEAIPAVQVEMLQAATPETLPAE